LPASKVKATFQLPSSASEWAGQLFVDWFPEGIVTSRSARAGFENISGWLKDESARSKKSLKARIISAGGQRLFFKQQVLPDWNSVFQARFPIQQPGCFVVIPSWKKVQALKGRHRIILNPGQAFGTGLHATTRLMLRFLQARGTFAAGMEVLDVGAGSGILGFAALALGAGRVIASEREAAACAQMRENRELNSILKSRFKIVCGSFPEAGGLGRVRAEVVLANIVTPVLLQLLPRLKAGVKKGGWLALSGIYGKNEADQLARALKKLGFLKIHRSSQGKWWCLSSKR
jgi:ribosomal protein L11 methyltransferase